MASFLEKVRHLKNVRVVCFDPAPDDINGQDRDTKMALALRASFVEMKPSILVILAGNIHSSLAMGTPWDPDYKPMTYNLYSLPDSPFLRSDILAIRARNLKGAAWVCFEGKPCGENDIPDGKSSYSEALTWGAYFLKETDLTRGYNATFFSRIVSASTPLVEKPK